MDPTNTENKTALKRLMGWLFAPDAPTMVLAATLDFDSEKLLAQCDMWDVFRLAYGLKLSTECAQLALDVAKVVAHLDPDPRVQACIEAAERCLNGRTDKNQDAANEAIRPADDAMRAMCAYDEDTRHVHYAARAATIAAKTVLAVMMPHVTHEAEKTCVAAREAAQDHPELIHSIDTIEARLRTAVYNALMGEIERLT